MWQHVQHNGIWYVFKGGALLDPNTNCIEVGGNYEPDVILVKVALNYYEQQGQHQNILKKLNEGVNLLEQNMNIGDTPEGALALLKEAVQTFEEIK